MDRQTAEKRIKKLREVINHYRYLYHVLDKQEISDAALDTLKHELYQLEDQFPELITSDSPTQRVGGEPLKEFTEARHRIPMLSLEDVFNHDEFLKWDGRVQKAGGMKTIEYFIEPKFDGLAISLIYKKSIFVQGSTRGDGSVGENVTANLKTIESIPLKLEQVKYVTTGDELEVRGEIVINKKNFEKINVDRKKKGEPLYANPRNLAAGSIRQLDSKIAARRRLEFYAYDIITDVGQKLHSEEHELLRQLGFRTARYARICNGVDDVESFVRDLEKKREKLEYHIDGVVASVNKNALFEKLGVVGKAPRGAIAYKFAPRESVTKVKDIVVQVGRTGVLTPVAVLEPVLIGGVTVSRATLHNVDEIRRLGVKVGDSVIVGRAGDVIPYISKVLKEFRTGTEKEFHMPRACPVCGSKIEHKNGEVAYRCTNKKCPALHRENLYHFVSRSAFDIDGLGPKIIDALVECGLLRDAGDLFVLKREDLLSIPRFAEKSADNLITSIQSKRIVSLSRFIYALGILHVGEQTSYELAKYFKNFDALQEASEEKLRAVSHIGDVVARSLYQWFRDPVNRKLVQKLKKYVSIQSDRSQKHVLSGKHIVVTGSLFSFNRDEIKERLRHLGARVSGLVSRQTDLVVVGENPGSKFEKAKKLGVKILDEKALIRILDFYR